MLVFLRAASIARSSARLRRSSGVNVSSSTSGAAGLFCLVSPFSRLSPVPAFRTLFPWICSPPENPSSLSLLRRFVLTFSLVNSFLFLGRGSSPSVLFRFETLMALCRVSKSGATCTAEGSKSANCASSTSERRDSSSESSSAAWAAESVPGGALNSAAVSSSWSSLSDGRSKPSASGGGTSSPEFDIVIGRDS